MKQGPQYTSCVQPGDFTSKGATLAYAALNALLGGAIAAGLALLFTGGLALGWAAMAAVVAALREILDWTVNGKLVCLYRDASHGCNCGDGGNQICAIGQIVDTEDVGQDKNPIEDLDNDYGMNLLLAPLTYRALWLAGGDDARYTLASGASQPQGDLVAHGLGSDFDHKAYTRTVVYNPEYDAHKAWTEIVGRDYGWGVGTDDEAYIDFLVKNGWSNATTKMEVPVFHCEFEGSRQSDVLDALDAFSLGGSWCKKNFLFGALCKLLQAILAPVALAAAMIAWAAADDGDPADALEGGGTIAADDWVVARGRWVYDGGHDGWNEMHATRIVQKVEPQGVPADAAAYAAYMEKWCDLLSEVPRPGSTSEALTPEQEKVRDAQGRPENKWELHPELDGCDPAEKPDPEPDPGPPDIH